MAHHGHSCNDPNHKHDDPEKGFQYSLFTKIDMENMECLNEVVENSGKSVFKPWEERLSKNKYVESDADEELLFNIPFTGSIKLKGIVVIGDNTNSHPSTMRLFKNREFMTFDDVSITPDQQFDLQKDPEGLLEYSTRVVTFNNVTHLTLHFPTNFGEEHTVIYYIGLKGEFTEAHRHGVTICNYELRPNLSDHKNPLDDIVKHHIT